MGTRSLTKFVDRETPLLCFYRQMDGYPDVHGQELADFLASKTMTNGINAAPTKLALSNGVHDLAAQTLVHFKTQDGHEIGGIYVYAPDVTDVGEEWTYFVSVTERDDKDIGTSGAGEIELTVRYGEDELWRGAPRDFDAAALARAAYGEEE